MTIEVSPQGPSLATSQPVDRDAYLAHLLSQRQSLKSDAIAGLHDLREQAVALLQDQALPTTRDEEWRFTDLSSLLQIPFQSVSQADITVSADQIESLRLPEAANHSLVFVNGQYAPGLSAVDTLPTGTRIGNLQQDPDLQEKVQAFLGKQPKGEEVFTALNTASLTDAAVVWIPKNQQVETPIHLLLIAAGAETPVLVQPRVLVVAESGSTVTLIEEYASLGQGVYFTNAVTEIWVEANAEVRHTRIQRESDQAFHIGKTAIAQARDSRYTCNAISFGAKLSRHNLDVFQTGPQTDTTLNGLTLIRGNQIADTHSAIAYTHPHSTSQQVHKCIVDDAARAVFNGKVFVGKQAQLTDAGQLNRNLLLSTKARVDTKPQLEIIADNVKCTHGATVSQLDEDEVFYLQSRGLNQASACQLLITAFATDVIQRIGIPSLEKTLARFVTTLGRATL